MRGAPILLLVAACGRLGFGEHAAVVSDAPQAIDAPALTLAGLVARYPMDDDPSGGAIGSPQLPGNCAGTCPTPTVGRFSGGYHFNGAAYFAIPSTTLSGTSTPYSISIWMQLEMYLFSAGQPLVSKSQDTGQGDTTNIVMVDDLVDYETSADGSNPDYVHGTTSLTLATWHHIGVTWDGATKRVYQDGVLQNMETPTAALDSTQVVHVGADFDNAGPSFFYTGTLDELQFYGRTLSDAEMLSLAQ